MNCAWCRPATQSGPQRGVSHGMCRRHELEQYIEDGMATWPEKLEYWLLESRAFEWIFLAGPLAFALYLAGHILAAAWRIR